MIAPHVEEILRDTFGHAKFSRTQKQQLRALCDEIAGHRPTLNAIRARAFDLVREAGGDPALTPRLNWLEDVLKILGGTTKLPQAGSRACFSPGRECRATIIDGLRRAVVSVDICVFTITDNQLCDEILHVHRRRLPVRIITDNDKAEDHGSDIETLHKAGVPVRTDETQYHMHHKFTVLDGQSVITGSYNWTRGAAEQNNENLVIITERPTVADFIAEFEKLWRETVPSRPK